MNLNSFFIISILILMLFFLLHHQYVLIFLLILLFNIKKCAVEPKSLLSLALAWMDKCLPNNISPVRNNRLQV